MCIVLSCLLMSIHCCQCNETFESVAVHMPLIGLCTIILCVSNRVVLAMGGSGCVCSTFNIILMETILHCHGNYTALSWKLYCIVTVHLSIVNLVELLYTINMQHETTVAQLTGKTTHGCCPC